MVCSVVGGFVLWGTQHRSMNGAKQTGWAIELEDGCGMYDHCILTYSVFIGSFCVPTSQSWIL